MTLHRKLRTVFAVVLTAAALSACATARKDDVPPAASGIVSGPADGGLQDFILNAGDRIFFETDSSEITPQARETLDRQAAWMIAHGRPPFTVEGHADERGTREYNIALGARRANAVRSYMLTKGIAAGEFRTISYGKERPVAVCTDLSCQSQNRRAMTVPDTGPRS